MSSVHLALSLAHPQLTDPLLPHSHIATAPLAEHKPHHAVERVHQLIDVERLRLRGRVFFQLEGSHVEVDEPEQTVFVFFIE